jgi:hypothetical protein
MTTEAGQEVVDTEESLSAAFSSGFAAARGEESAPEVKPADAPAASPEPPAPVAAETPAAVTPPAPPEDLATKVAKLEGMLNDTTHRLRSSEGRVGSLQRTLEELKKAAPAPTPPPPPPSPAAEKLRADYPDLGPAAIAAIEEALSHAQAGQSAGLTPDQVAEVVRANVAPLEVELVHRGWRDTVKTTEFKTWFERQPEDVRVLAASKSSADAIKLMDTFKSAKPAPVPPPPAPPPAPDSRKLEAAQAVGSRARAESTTALSDEAAFKLGFAQARSGV